LYSDSAIVIRNWRAVPDFRDVVSNVGIQMLILAIVFILLQKLQKLSNKIDGLVADIREYGAIDAASNRRGFAQGTVVE